LLGGGRGIMRKSTKDALLQSGTACWFFSLKLEPRRLILWPNTFWPVCAFSALESDVPKLSPNFSFGWQWSPHSIEVCWLSNMHWLHAWKTRST
jgi:hypothetical protein